MTNQRSAELDAMTARLIAACEGTDSDPAVLMQKLIETVQERRNTDWLTNYHCQEVRQLVDEVTDIRRQLRSEMDAWRDQICWNAEFRPERPEIVKQLAEQLHEKLIFLGAGVVMRRKSLKL